MYSIKSCLNFVSKIESSRRKALMSNCVEGGQKPTSHKAKVRWRGGKRRSGYGLEGPTFLSVWFGRSGWHRHVSQPKNGWEALASTFRGLACFQCPRSIRNIQDAELLRRTGRMFQKGCKVFVKNRKMERPGRMNGVELQDVVFRLICSLSKYMGCIELTKYVKFYDQG